MFALKQVLEQLVFLRHEGFGADDPGIGEVARSIPKPIHSVQRKTFLLFFFHNLIVDGFGGCIRRSNAYTPTLLKPEGFRAEAPRAKP